MPWEYVLVVSVTSGGNDKAGMIVPVPRLRRQCVTEHQHVIPRSDSDEGSRDANKRSGPEIPRVATAPLGMTLRPGHAVPQGLLLLHPPRRPEQHVLHQRRRVRRI